MFKNFFNKNYQLKTDKEKQIHGIITNICKKEDTDVRIDPFTKNIFISNEDKHYDIVLMSQSIVITNTKFSLRESFNFDFIEVLMQIALQRASKDRQKVLEEILSRETEMLETIEKSLEEI